MGGLGIGRVSGALHALGGFKEGLWDGGRALVAPRLFVIYCPLPRDLTPVLLLLSFLLLPPYIFNVLIVPTVNCGGGGERRGLSPLSHRGLHECSRCGEGEGETGLGNYSASFQRSAVGFFFLLH